MFDEKMKEYYDKFGSAFPMIPLGWGRSDDEVVEMIQKCLDADKDVYAMGFVLLGDDLEY